MNNSEFIKSLEKLMIDDNLEKALSEIIVFSGFAERNEIKDDAIQLLARRNRIKKEFDRDIVKQDDFRIEISKIRNGIISLKNQIGSLGEMNFLVLKKELFQKESVDENQIESIGHQIVKKARVNWERVPNGFVKIWLQEFNDEMIIINPEKFNSFQDLADTLYFNYLNKFYPPLSYGQKWIMFEHEKVFNPGLFVVPWEWLKIKNSKPISEYMPYWGIKPLNEYGILPNTTWDIKSPNAKYFEYEVQDVAYGIALNNSGLMNHIFTASGKQPHPPVRAGYLQVVEQNEIVPEQVKHKVIAFDCWSGKPFSGRVIIETEKKFDWNKIVSNEGEHKYFYGR